MGIFCSQLLYSQDFISIVCLSVVGMIGDNQDTQFALEKIPQIQRMENGMAYSRKPSHR